MRQPFAGRGERLAPAVFILPAVLIVLAMSIFPLIVSLYLSLSRFKLAKGGFTVDFIGTLNFQKLLFGSQQFHLLGKLVPFSPIAWVCVAVVVLAALWPAVAGLRRGAGIGFVIGRLVDGRGHDRGGPAVRLPPPAPAASWARSASR